MSFRPPPDLLRRLDALPQSYLRQRNLADRLRLTTDKVTANKSLSDAVNAKAEDNSTGTAWPEIHHLGPQHPFLDWLADKLLYRVGRNEAMVIPCDVDAPTILMSGVWSNKVGEPIASVWLGATVEDGIVSFEEMFPLLQRAGITDGMVNPGWEGDPAALQGDLAAVVEAVKSMLGGEMEYELAVVKERLTEAQERLERWQSQAHAVAAGMTSDAKRTRQLTRIERVTHQIAGLIIDREPASTPLIRVVGALVPRT